MTELWARPREATEEVLIAWIRDMSRWPLAKIRKHQRINHSYRKRTADLEVMRDVYRRAVGLKVFPEWSDDATKK